MARAGQEIESPGGMKLRFMQTGAETGGEFLFCVEFEPEFRLA